MRIDSVFEALKDAFAGRYGGFYMLLKKFSAFMLAAFFLLSLGGCSCTYSVKVDDNGVIKFGKLYVSDSSVFQGKFESYASGSLERADNVEWEKIVKVGAAEYEMTLIDVEELRSSDGKRLGRTDKYFKAASAGKNPSPKIRASYDYFTKRLMTLVVEDSSFFRSVKSERDMKVFLSDSTSGLEGIDECGQERIVCYADGEWQEKFVPSAEIYSITRVRREGALNCGSVTLTVSENALVMIASLPKIGKYQSFLKSVSVSDIERAVQKRVKVFFANGESEELEAAETIKVDPDTCYFEYIGGNPCFLFEASYETDSGNRFFSAILFLK